MFFFKLWKWIVWVLKRKKKLKKIKTTGQWVRVLVEGPGCAPLA